MSVILRLRLLGPKTSALLTRFALEPAKLLEVLKRKPRIRKAVPLADDLCIHEGSVGQENVRQSTLVAIVSLNIVF